VIEIQPANNIGMIGGQQAINDNMPRGLSPRIGMENPAHGSL
jgi:hypothetical protein